MKIKSWFVIWVTQKLKFMSYYRYMNKKPKAPKPNVKPDYDAVWDKLKLNYQTQVLWQFLKD